MICPSAQVAAKEVGGDGPGERRGDAGGEALEHDVAGHDERAPRGEDVAERFQHGVHQRRVKGVGNCKRSCFDPLSTHELDHTTNHERFTRDHGMLRTIEGGN